MKKSARPGDGLSLLLQHVAVPEGFPTELLDLTSQEVALLRALPIHPFFSNKELAKYLKVSPKTISNRKSDIAQKLGIYGQHTVQEFAVSVKQWLEVTG